MSIKQGGAKNPINPAIPYFGYVTLVDRSSMEDNDIIAGYVCSSVFGSEAGITLAVMFKVRSSATTKPEILAAVEIIPIQNLFQVMVHFFTFLRKFSL